MGKVRSKRSHRASRPCRVIPATIAFLGNYLPRKCGIATFTSDLLGAVAVGIPKPGASRWR